MIVVRFLSTITGSSRVLSRTFESEAVLAQWLTSVHPMVEIVSVTTAVSAS